ncbi:hypothetical protein ACVIHC_005431 [Bradyrhizobium diazoefficiens]
MPRVLRNLRIDEVSCVLMGANPGAKVLIRKSADKPDFWDVPLPRGAQLFNDIMVAKAARDDDVTGDHDGDDDKKLSGKLKEFVAVMVRAAPTLSEEEALFFLLHHPRGRRLAEHLNNISKQKEQTIMPQVNIMKLIEVTEQGLMAQVAKRDGESYHQAFARRHENDIAFRKQWASLTDAKHLVALRKGMASLTPTSTSVGDTSVADDAAEAVRLLSEMAERQHRSFEQVFTDPANATLATRTYTQHHRSSISYGSQEG